MDGRLQFHYLVRGARDATASAVRARFQLIDCDEAEKAYADNMYERSQLNYLLDTDPKGYAELIWAENPRAYLKTVTEYYPLSSLR